MTFINKALKFSTLLLGLSLSFQALGFDVCDPVDIKSEIDAWKATSVYLNCESKDMISAYENSSKELIDVLALLKDTYKQSMVATEDESKVEEKVSDYNSGLIKAKETIAKGNNLDLSSDPDFSELIQWVEDVNTYTQSAREKFSIIQQDNFSDQDKFTVCQEKYSWKMSKLWHDRILKCIDLTLSETNSGMEPERNP